MIIAVGSMLAAQNVDRYFFSSSAGWTRGGCYGGEHVVRTLEWFSKRRIGFDFHANRIWLFLQNRIWASELVLTFFVNQSPNRILLLKSDLDFL